jgi:hypothetical protein
MDKKIMIIIVVLGMAMTIHAQTDPQSIIDSKMSETNPSQNYTGQATPAESRRKSPAKQNGPKEPAGPQKIIDQSPLMGQIDLSLQSRNFARMQKHGKIKVLPTVYN